eukprot:SAG31_NODE_4095_length_3592_cov_2.576009_1_plen_177_part_10
MNFEPLPKLSPPASLLPLPNANVEPALLLLELAVEPVAPAPPLRVGPAAPTRAQRVGQLRFRWPVLPHTEHTVTACIASAGGPTPTPCRDGPHPTSCRLRWALHVGWLLLRDTQIADGTAPRREGGGRPRGAGKRTGSVAAGGPYPGSWPCMPIARYPAEPRRWRAGRARAAWHGPA